MSFEVGDYVECIETDCKGRYNTPGRTYRVTNTHASENNFISYITNTGEDKMSRAKLFKRAELPDYPPKQKEKRSMNETQWKLSGQSEKMYDIDDKGRMRSASYVIHSGNDGTAKFVKTISTAGLQDTTHESVVNPLKTKTALSVAYTKVNHKLKLMGRKGWVADPKDVGQFVFKPMLLEDYKKKKGQVKFPCIVQPKLDGVRSLFDRKNNTLVSRGSKLWNLPHILEELKDFPDYLDGELYSEGFALQDIVSMVKHSDEKIKYYVFDMPDSSGLSPYSARLRKLVAADMKYKYVEVVGTSIANNHEEIEEIHKLHLAAGFEGSVIKNLDSLYEWNDRSKEVLKLKPLFSEEFPIVGVVSDNLSTGGKGIKYICKSSVGGEFEVVPKMTHGKRREALADFESGKSNPVGQAYTVEFRGLSNSNTPTHAVGIGIREDL
ncbi:MAG: hypothetical protein KAS32_02395 [Candidatus Peribacteraceae bacterium]|nr:hypothetical protein [Candidatus Peribacteraceae bacterium]